MRCTYFFFGVQMLLWYVHICFSSNFSNSGVLYAPRQMLTLSWPQFAPFYSKVT